MVDGCHAIVVLTILCTPGSLPMRALNLPLKLMSTLLNCCMILSCPAVQKTVSSCACEPCPAPPQRCPARRGEQQRRGPKRPQPRRRRAQRGGHGAAAVHRHGVGGCHLRWAKRSPGRRWQCLWHSFSKKVDELHGSGMISGFLC